MAPSKVLLIGATGYIGKHVALASAKQGLERSGIPYTFLCLGAFAGYYLYPIVQDARAPPREGKLLVLGDGDARAVFAAEEDVAAFAVRTIDDPRAENKTVHFRAGPNVASTNEVVALWEKKLGRTFEKEFLDREGVLQSIAALPFPDNLMRAIKYSIFVKGDQTSFALDPAKDVEATALYPDVKFTTIDEYLSRLV